ncbi:MAG TPA: hypothetical protein VEU74_12105 [Gemmatimonadales bacterium]|nr:hypothetical protein [Gemmatimonadales bacterium]
MNLAQLIDSVPTVQSAADRGAKFPSPVIDQKVYNKATGNIEAWTGAVWAAFVLGVAATVGFSKTVDAGLYTGGTNEANISAAIAAAPGLGATRVWIRQSQQPFNVNLVALNPAIQLVAEGEPVANGVYSVIAYGADRTGVTDAGPAWNAARSQVPATGGTVSVPAGSYNLVTAFTFGAATNVLLRIDNGTVLTGQPLPISAGTNFTFSVPGGPIHINMGLSPLSGPPIVGQTINGFRCGLWVGGGLAQGIDSYLARIAGMSQAGMCQSDVTQIANHDAPNERIIYEGIGGRGTYLAPAGLLANDLNTRFKADAFDSNGAQTVSVAGIDLVCEINSSPGKVPSGIWFFTMDSTGTFAYRWLIQNSGLFRPYIDNAYNIGNGGAGNPSPQRVKTVYAMQVFAELGDGGFQVLNANNGAAANTATLTNAPVAGNPTFWLKIAVNNTFKFIPCW